MEDGRITDWQVTASSELSSKSLAANARLNHGKQFNRLGAWIAANNTASEWIQVDLVFPSWISGVMIQGREDFPQWVSKFKVSFTQDQSFWNNVRDNNNDVVSFQDIFFFKFDA